MSFRQKGEIAGTASAPSVRDLRPRLFFSRALFAILLLSVAYSVANVAAPFTLAPGTAVHLDGFANRVDNGAVYNTWPLFPMVVYYLGDVQCHQMAARTIFLNGNEMPMDARMSSIYFWANLGLIAAMFATPSTSVAQGLVNALPKRVQPWVRRHLGPNVAVGLIVFLGLLPVAVDGFTQLLTPYESTNVKRFLTGIPGGFVAGLLVGVMVTSIRQVELETRELRARVRALRNPPAKEEDARPVASRSDAVLPSETTPRTLHPDARPLAGDAPRQGF